MVEIKADTRKVSVFYFERKIGMKFGFLLCCAFLICPYLGMRAITDVDSSFVQLAKIQQEMQFWQEEIKRLEKQKDQGNVSPAYLMMLNGILTQMQTLRKQAVQLIERTQTEEEKIKKESVGSAH